MVKTSVISIINFCEAKPEVEKSCCCQSAIAINDYGNEAIINPDTALETLYIAIKNNMKFDNIEKWKADEIINYLIGVFRA